MGAFDYKNGKLGNYSNIVLIPISTTWIVPPDVYKIRVHATGAGGSGGYSTPASGGRVTGGGGGGCAIKTFNTVPGDRLTIVIGAGGAAVSGVGNGNGGGSTTVTYGGYTITGGGAGAGQRSASSVQCNGGTGGTALNGDLNVTGGAAVTFTNTAAAAVGGGGAAGGVWGTPPSAAIGPANTFLTHGGSSVYFYPVGTGYQADNGCGTRAASGTAIGSNIHYSPFIFTGAGGAVASGQGTANPGDPGCGGGSIWTSTDGGTGYGGRGGFCAGGGGAGWVNVQNQWSYGGAGGAGGGGGGGYGYSGGSSGAGGDGFVVIEW